MRGGNDANTVLMYDFFKNKTLKKTVKKLITIKQVLFQRCGDGSLYVNQ